MVKAAAMGCTHTARAGSSPPAPTARPIIGSMPYSRPHDGETFRRGSPTLGGRFHGSHRVRFSDGRACCPEGHAPALKKRQSARFWASIWPKAQLPPLRAMGFHGGQGGRGDGQVKTQALGSATRSSKEDAQHRDPPQSESSDAIASDTATHVSVSWRMATLASDRVAEVPRVIKEALAK